MSVLTAVYMSSKQINPVYMNTIDYPDVELSVEGWGKRLEQVLEDKGISNSAAADAIGVNGSTIGRYIGGQNPTLANVIALANFLKVDPAWLLFGAESTKDIWVLDKRRVTQDPEKAVKAMSGLIQSLMEMYTYALKLTGQSN